jgi:hypothetical protein
MSRGAHSRAGCTRKARRSAGNSLNVGNSGVCVVPSGTTRFVALPASG